MTLALRFIHPISPKEYDMPATAANEVDQR